MEQQNFPSGMADMIGELAKNPALMSTIASLLPTLLSSAGSGAENKAGKKEEAQAANAAPPDPIYLSPDSAKEEETAEESAPAAAVHDVRAAGSGRALLLALKPYLSEERRSKLDRIASLSDVLEAMGSFSLKGGK